VFVIVIPDDKINDVELQFIEQTLNVYVVPGANPVIWFDVPDIDALDITVPSLQVAGATKPD